MDDAEGETVLLEDLCVSLRTHARAGNFLCCWNAIVAIARLAGSEEAARAAIDAVDENGETALTLAVVHGNARLVQVSLLFLPMSMCQSKASVTVDVLHSGHNKCALQTLLQKGANSEHRPSKDIPSPLVRARDSIHTRSNSMRCWRYF